MANNLHGIDVMLSTYLVEKVERVVTLTWRQRLLSWPWRPWVKTRTVVDTIPHRSGMMFNGKMLMHPTTFEALRAQLGGH